MISSKLANLSDGSARKALVSTSSELSFHEEKRLAAVAACHVLDTAAESAFDSISTLVQEICETPVVAVSFVDSRREWFKSEFGILQREIPRSLSLGAHVITRPHSILSVSDAHDDARFSHLPLVRGGPNIRFYTGVPVILKGGYAVGVLSVADSVKRTLSTDQTAALKDAAQAVVSLLEHRQLIGALKSSRALVGNTQSVDELDERRVVCTLPASVPGKCSLPVADVIDALPGIFYVFDADGKFVLWNKRFEDTTGYSGREIEDLHPLQLFAGDDVALVTRGIARGFSEGWAEVDANLVTKTGKKVSHYFSGGLVTFEGRSCQAGMGIDTSERKRAEELLKHSALHDSLTGLPNRDLLDDRLAEAVASAERLGIHAAVIFLDLDRFKNVNDTLGHRFGDELLKAVVGRLLGCVRSTDTVARLGGDEFVIVTEVVRRQDVAAIVENLSAVFRQPFAVAGYELHVTASIGISISPEDGTQPEGLVRNADTAMYRAKEGGRNGYYFFTSDMHAAATRRLSTENDLRRALENDEFELYYQPTIDLQTGRAESAEALIRWNHPTRGLVSPSEFIDIAEETNLIVPIGAWVLRAGALEAKRLTEMGLPRCDISLNVSGRQLRDPAFLKHVRLAVRDSGVDPTKLGIEITESAALDDPDAAQVVLMACKDLGMTILLDDFGTHYSSLTYLKKFPIDIIKIDKSFVDGLPGDLDDAAIVEAIIGLGKNLNCDVLAEGVETLAQSRWLADHDCRFATGYLYAAPMPALDFERWLMAVVRTP